MLFKKHLKDNLFPKYDLKKQTYVCYAEYDNSDPEPNVASSGGLATLEHFLENYQSGSLYRDNDNCHIEVLYTFEAASPEEASFIRDLREYGTAYNPIGDSEICHSCKRFYVFPKSSCKCPLCGYVDEAKQAEYTKNNLNK